MSHSNGSCFVVDDDPGVRRIIVHATTKMGVDAVECASPAATFAALDRDRPDLIFLDVGLGCSDASAVLKGLAERGFEGAIKLVSGRSAEQLEQLSASGAAMGLAMLAPLTKPFSLVRNPRCRRYSLAENW